MSHCFSPITQPIFRALRTHVHRYGVRLLCTHHGCSETSLCCSAAYAHPHKASCTAVEYDVYFLPSTLSAYAKTVYTLRSKRTEITPPRSRERTALEIGGAAFAINTLHTARKRTSQTDVSRIIEAKLHAFYDGPRCSQEGPASVMVAKGIRCNPGSAAPNTIHSVSHRFYHSWPSFAQLLSHTINITNPPHREIGSVVGSQ